VSHESNHRFNFIVELLINSKEGKTVREIMDRLDESSFEEITVERLRKLLRKMSEDPRLDVRRTGNGYGDRWIANYLPGEVDLVAMTPSRAVWLSLLAKADINQLLPKIIRDELAPEQDIARSRLEYVKKARGRGVLGWVNRVRLGRPSVRLAVDREEPEINPEVETAIHNALTDRNPVKIRYWSGHLSDELGDALVYPIGLDCQLRWVTLVCQIAEPCRTELKRRSPKYGDDYVQMPMHRIHSAERVDTTLPPSFDAQFTMEHYVNRAEPDRPRGGEQGFTQGKKIKLVALVTESYANDLFESPLQTVGEPQNLVMEDSGRFRLTADLIQSDNLLWWCAAMAGDMVVVEPEDFRREVVEMLDAGRALYDQH
jgi:hypothetical protein